MNDLNVNRPESKELKLNNLLLTQLPNAADGVCRQAQAAVSMDELFAELERCFADYQDAEKLKEVLPSIHNSVKLYVGDEFANQDIGLYLFYLYELHHEDESELMIVLQILHQFLHSFSLFKSKHTQFSSKIIMAMINHLPDVRRRVSVSNIIYCIQLYISLFPDNGNIVERLWADVSKRLDLATPATRTDIDILVQLYDEFSAQNPQLHKNAIVAKTIQNLFDSIDREERKCGYYLFKKLKKNFTDSLSHDGVEWLSKEHVAEIDRSWILYITILENLEENQSHLILPSLKNLYELITKRQIKNQWLEILLRKVLVHKNAVVKRWSVEFFLGTFKCSELSRDTLPLLLEAINSNALYNYEGYFIERKLFTSFMDCELSALYEMLSCINWKPVPLCNLLSVLHEKEKPSSLDFQLVLGIASRVRALTDVHIRQRAASLLNEHFGKMVSGMTMQQFVTYVETLYTSADRCNIFEELYSKAHFIDASAPKDLFSRRFFQIALTNLDQTSTHQLIQFLRTITIENHGWLKFLPFHFGMLRQTTEEDEKQLMNWYGINNDSCKKGMLSECIAQHAEVLRCTRNKDELKEATVATIAVYISHMSNFNHLNSDTLSVLLEHDLPEQTVRKICLCLNKTSSGLPAAFVERLTQWLSYVKVDYLEYRNLFYYLERNEDLKGHINELLDKCPQFVKPRQLSDCFYRSDLYRGDVRKGDNRIEECYRYHELNQTPQRLHILRTWCLQTRMVSDVDFLRQLVLEHKEVSAKKPRYFANSYEHRMKMRIAAAVAALMYNVLITSSIPPTTLNMMWDILLNENNQTNISCFYEFAIGYAVNESRGILEKLNQAHQLAPSQQVSIISVALVFCMHKIVISQADVQEVLNHLLPLSMGANFQTRLMAQMAMYTLVTSPSLKGGIAQSSTFASAIETAAGKNLENYLHDLRIQLPNFCNTIWAWERIMYITNAPYDEIVWAVNTPSDQEVQARKTYMQKNLQSPQSNEFSKDLASDQLQRKMSPLSEVMEPHNLYTFPSAAAESEMFVVASLVDKLPNLGGIARTCEVLGIKNLVIHSQRDIERDDFKNLSMTAEKYLNIIEVKHSDLRGFLMEKQREGFCVIGAEQTSKSEAFNKFQFPRKCILLLGHEKDGIPATLLQLLDHAVEIPQFGQVRSFNVHVTGALFMWEYCRQHMVR